MSARESKSKTQFGGSESLDPVETMRLLKAFMAITDDGGRRSLIEFAESLAMPRRSDANPPP